jgi:hypothetical protein
MKKILLSLLLVSFASMTFASDADLFKFDYNSVQSEFAELNKLAGMVAANTDLTYTELKLSNETLVNNLKLIPDMGVPGSAPGEPVLGIPSFLWGCVFGVVGLAVVYIGTDEDKDETKKALWGCVTGTGVVAIVYLVYWITVVNVAVSVL